MSSLHHRAVERLGRAIVSGEYPTDSVLFAEQLETELGVGRSVVREAVRVLQSLGLVTTTRRVGIRIRPVGEWTLLDPRVITWRLEAGDRGAQLRSLTELRSAVEPMAAELAATHASEAAGAELLSTAARMRSIGRAGDLAGFLELDIAFHCQVLTGSGNEMFAQMADMIGAVLRGRTELGLMPARPHEEALQWHVDVADAVQAGDPQRARDAMDAIMRRTAAEVDSLWRDLPRSV